MKPQKIENEPQGVRKFRLDKSNPKLAGVCGGIGDYFNIDPVVVRIGFIAAGLIGLGLPLVLYFATAVIAD